MKERLHWHRVWGLVVLGAAFVHAGCHGGGPLPPPDPITKTPSPGSHSVRLDWDPSTSSVAGYNVYRATTSGGPYTKMNSAVIMGTSFEDSSVQAGETYFFVVTAVNFSNLESPPSNEVVAAIPTT